jgi:predicted transcriptional regulator of viral defense system
MQQDVISDMSTRHVPRSVASAIADFEMFDRDIVSVNEVAAALGVTADSRRLKNAIHTLVRLGWLRPLPTRGAYEFLAARGGPFPSGEPLVEARAVRARRPDFRLAVIGTGAAFLRGFSDRAPGRYAVAIDHAQGGSVALAAAYDVVKTSATRIADIPDLRDVPVSDAAHLLADAALWPQASGDLRDADHWLRRALKATPPAAAAIVARRFGNAATARMAYLALRFDAPEVAGAVAATLRSRARTSIGKADAPIIARDAALGVIDRLGVATLR